MSNDDLLVQDEIDALLNSVSGGGEQEETSSKPKGDARIRPFNPATQHRIIRERMHSLDIINERFARSFRISLFNLIRRNADITVGPVEYQSYSSFARYVPVPANINLISMKPLRGSGVIIFPPAMVFMIVDNLFGGDGRFLTRSEGREFTKTEQRIIARTLDLAMEAYQDSWQSIFPVEISYVRSEMQAKFASITNSPNEIVVNTTFHFEVGNLNSEFHVCLPYAMLEPIKELLTNPLTDNQDRQENWTERMASEIKQAKVELVSDLVNLERSLGEVVALKVGDILPITLPEEVDVKVDGVPVLRGRYGSNNGRKALRVTKILDHNHGAPPKSLFADTLSNRESPIEEREDDQQHS